MERVKKEGILGLFGSVFQNCFLLSKTGRTRKKGRTRGSQFFFLFSKAQKTLNSVLKNSFQKRELNKSLFLILIFLCADVTILSLSLSLFLIPSIIKKGDE